MSSTDTRESLYLEYEATALNDNTVRLGGLVLDIPPGPHNPRAPDRRLLRPYATEGER